MWYIKAILNNLQAPCNSSPTFSNKPIGVACNGQSFYFNPGAFDPNSDSLVYSFYSPFTSSSAASVTYAPPYSASNFSISNPPITLDPLTGDICFTAATNLTTITGIKVEEWRKINNVPTLIGTVYRDIQLKIGLCNNSIPLLSGMDTLSTHTYNTADSTYQIEMCLGPTLDFDINGFDLDTFNATVVGRSDIFHLSWNHGIPQGAFTTNYNGTDSAYAHFNWTPTSADVSNVPKCFTVTIHDEACPYYGSQTFSYCVTVRGMAVDIGPHDTLLCSGETMNVFATADTTTKNYIWKWNGVPTSTPLTNPNYFVNTNTYPPGVDTISIETNDSSTTTTCPGRDFMIVNHVYQPHIQGTIPDSAFCEGGSVTFDAGQGTNYLWMKINPSNAFIGASKTQLIDTIGVYTVFVDGGSNTLCNDQDTFVVSTIINPILGADTAICITGTVTIDAGAGYSYSWSTGDNTQTIDVIGANIGIGIHNYSVTVERYGCTATDDINIMVIPCTGIDEYEGALSILIYPYPNNGLFNVEVFTDVASNFNYSILDMTGKQIETGEINTNGATMHSQQFDLSVLAKGVYFFKLQNDNIVKIERIIIQ